MILRDSGWVHLSVAEAPDHRAHRAERKLRSDWVNPGLANGGVIESKIRGINAETTDRIRKQFCPGRPHPWCQEVGFRITLLVRSA